MHTLKKYSTLLIDADNTLLDFSLAERLAITSACEKFGIEPDEKNAALYSEINLSLWKRHEKGEVTKDEIKLFRFMEFIKAVGSSADPKEMGKYYEKTLAAQGHLLPGAIDFLKSIRPFYKTYIVTNGLAAVQHSRLGLSGILPFFDGLFISEEYGSKKPEKLFFDRISDNIPEKDKSRICVIGDSMSSDILFGINAGIDTCYFAPKGAPEPYTPTLRAESFEELTKIFG
ncbi:MAG: YjjG family noncanonical pyrimidine nucleotidase [Clostridia bacterium]|nr:YjjG family noncanonical pyrimidine nucleotidase [Clostridia bacterium]